MWNEHDNFSNTDLTRETYILIKCVNFISLLQTPPTISRRETAIPQYNILHDSVIKTEFSFLYLGQRSHRCDQVIIYSSNLLSRELPIFFIVLKTLIAARRPCRPRISEVAKSLPRAPLQPPHVSLLRYPGTFLPYIVTNSSCGYKYEPHLNPMC